MNENEMVTAVHRNGSSGLCEPLIKNFSEWTGNPTLSVSTVMTAACRSGRHRGSGSAASQRGIQKRYTV